LVGHAAHAISPHSRAIELHGGNGAMLDFGIEKLFRDAAIFLHMDATVDVSRFKIVKSMFPATAGAYAGP
jgi:alkylation response protein AidB-like acyl-CoA dehydrogenase